MSELDLLSELILTYAIALALVVALARIGVPSLVSMIIAGAVSGPAGLQIVDSEEQVELLAQVGVALLLFTVGLEFSTSHLRRAWRPIVGGGFLQMAGTAVLAGGLLVATGAPVRLAVLVGFFVAMSSTALVLKELATRNQVTSAYGRLAVGILLFQDLCVVFLLLLVPILAGQTSIAEVPFALGRAAIALVIVAVGGRLVLRRFLSIVTASRRREAFPLAIVLASVGTAWVSTQLGVPMALGAFLGGLMLAESEFSHQAYAEIRPLRDILSSLFFVSLGMLIEPPLVVRSLPLILGAAVLIIVLKGAITVGACLAASGSVRLAVAAGLALSQVGEFSFIIGQLGVDAGLVEPEMWQILLASSIVTMTVTPLLVQFAPAVGARVAELFSPSSTAEAAELPSLTGHVVILGFGVGGRLLAESLREVGRPYVILELNGATVRRARAQGEPILYADATHPDALRAVSVNEAMAIVSVLSDPDASARVLQTVREVCPTVPFIARTRYWLEAEHLQQLGASIAVAEELEASLEVLAHVLKRVQVPRGVIEPLLEAHRHKLAMVRAFDARPEDLIDQQAGEAGASKDDDDSKSVVPIP